MPRALSALEMARSDVTITKFDAIELLDAAYRIHHVASRFGSRLALWQTIAERNPSLTLTCIGNGTPRAVLSVPSGT